jgi:hypothetical protein
MSFTSAVGAKASIAASTIGPPMTQRMRIERRLPVMMRDYVGSWIVRSVGMRNALARFARSFRFRAIHVCSFDCAAFRYHRRKPRIEVNGRVRQLVRSAWRETVY